MKKMLKLSFTVLFVFLLSFSCAFAADSGITVYLDGEALNLTTGAVIQDGRTLVPFRSIFEAIGLEVDWDPDTKTVSGSSEDTEMSLVIGSTTAVVNGEEKTLDVAATIIDSSTMVPLRFIAESVGYTVDWIGTKQEVKIWSVDDEAYALYQKINEANADMTSAAMNMTADIGMVMSQDGETLAMDMKMSGDIKMIIASETDVQMEMNLKTTATAGGETESVDMAGYFKDGYMYMNSGGEKYKVAMNLEEAMAQASLIDTNDMDITASDIKGSKIETVTGGTKLTLVVKGSAMDDILTASLGAMEDLGLGEMTMTFGDVIMVTVVDENNIIKSQSIVADVDASYMGASMTMTMDMVMDMTAYGDAVKITFPTDLDKYEELSLEDAAV